MERKFKDWLMADVWTSAFFIEKTELDLEPLPYQCNSWKILRENQPVNARMLINRIF
jgi:hypothetical protein